MEYVSNAVSRESRQKQITCLDLIKKTTSSEKENKENSVPLSNFSGEIANGTL
jgi:hypothetical protein